jgi:hypothetical protein
MHHEVRSWVYSTWHVIWEHHNSFLMQHSLQYSGRELHYCRQTDRPSRARDTMSTVHPSTVTTQPKDAASNTGTKYSTRVTSEAPRRMFRKWLRVTRTRYNNFSNPIVWQGELWSYKTVMSNPQAAGFPHAALDWILLTKNWKYWVQSSTPKCFKAIYTRQSP